MNLTAVLLVGLGLSMDAFAVSVCKGLNMKKLNLKQGLIIALFFGVFQGGMPLIGYFLGGAFEKYIVAVDHWIAFALLALIGGKMCYDAIAGFVADKREKQAICNGTIVEKKEEKEVKFSIKEIFIMAIATSIDALAIGITFATGGLKISIWLAVSLICLITFALSFVGVIIGNKFGAKYRDVPVLIGGLVLIGIGIKILIEHLLG